jgi:hypothetical protein
MDGRDLYCLRRDSAALDASAQDEPAVRLLPRFDVSLLGYRSRELSVAAEQAKRVHPGGGIVHQTLLVDGWIMGTWSSTVVRGRMQISVAPFEPLPEDVRAAVAREAGDIGHFLGRDVSVELVQP